MNNLQSQTSGLDCAIKAFQIDLYQSLTSVYDFNIEGYSRVYKNPNEEGETILEVWNEEQKQYKELMLDSNLPYSFFFIDGDTHDTEDGVVFITPLKVVFIVDLSNIHQTVRADAEAQRQAVVSIKNDVGNSFEIEEIEKGVENVFTGFKTNDISFSDMHPYHVFSVNGKLSYNLNKTC